MRRVDIDLVNALDKAFLKQQGYQYIWIQNLSSVELGCVDSIRLDRDELLEARIFCEKKEIHIFFYEEELRAAELKLENTDEYFDEVQILRSRYSPWKQVVIRNLIGYNDTDGQAYIYDSMIADLRR